MKHFPFNSKPILFALAIFGLGALFMLLEGSQSAHAQGPSNNIETIVPIPPEILSALTDAIRRRPSNVLVGRDLQITSFKKSENWVLSTVALTPSTLDEGGSLLFDSTLVLASLSQGKWSGAIMGTTEYQQFLLLAPDSLIASAQKPFLLPSTSSTSTPESIGTPVKWPWTEGQSWYYSNGRHGTNLSAVDFGSGGIPIGQRYVRAAASGVVIRYCGPDASGQASLAIRTSTGASNDDVTGYLHLDGSTLTKNTGDWVNQGDILGQTYGNGSFPNTGCGYGDGPHVHFFNGVIPAGSNNGAQITPIDISGITICGWTLSSDNGFSKGGQTTRYPSSYIPYTSADCGGGTNHPPGTPSLSSPDDWSEFTQTQAPTLNWNSVSDPDGDSVQYYAEVFGSAVNANSGWISGTSWRPSSLDGQYYGYQWHVKARDEHGMESGWSSTWHFTLRQPQPRPSANFEASPTSGMAPLTVAFHILDTSNISSCSWNYGDGQTGTSCSSYHNHTYNNPGSYSVSLTVNGPGGSDTQSRSDYIGVTNPRPSTPSNPNPADVALVERTNNTTFYWSTNGTSCDIHIWGGPGINMTQNGISCSSFFWGVQWPGAYQWQVTAHNSYGTTAGPIWHLNIRPYSPTNLNSSPASPTQINLLWTKSSDDPGNVDNYKLHYSYGALIETLDAGTTSYTVDGLSCGNTYSFLLQAVRQGVGSVFINTSGSTQACAQPSVTVTSVATTDGPGDPKTTFNAGDVLGMRIYTNNTTSGQQSITLSWDVYDPNGSKVSALSYDNWQTTVAQGATWRGIGPIIPTTALGGTYTFRGTVVYNGATSTQSTQFVVIPCYTLTTSVNPGSSGSITASPGPNCGSQYTSGTNVQLTANGNSGYTFNSWSGGASGSTNPITITMSGNKSVTANFSAPQVCYSLILTSSGPTGHGTISQDPAPNCNGTQYTSGTKVGLTAIPNAGFVFTGWSEDVTVQSNTTSVTMNSIKRVTANFIASNVSISSVSPLPPYCVLRSASFPSDRLLTVTGLNFPNTDHHLQFLNLATSQTSMHFNMEVNWQGTSTASLDIARIKQHLWTDPKMTLEVRITGSTYQPLSNWSQQFTLAEDVNVCGIAQPRRSLFLPFIQR